MWLLRWLVISVGAVVAAPALAYWQVQSRPLDPKPYTRQLPSPVLYNSLFRSALDGNGLILKNGSNELFSVDASGERPKEFELQIGYLTKSVSFDPSATCSVELTLDGAETIKRSFVLPLRSIKPEALKVEDLKTRFDYLLNAQKVNLPRDAGQLRASATAKGCGLGDIVLFDPKVWEKVNDEPPKRMIVLVSDSIGKRWFEDGRRFMPATQTFFSGPGSFLDTKVISVATNTHDATRILSKARYDFRNGDAISGAEDVATGLVPDYMNAGYDVISYSSNFLLLNSESGTGFRHLFTVDIGAGEAGNRNDEFRVPMMLDWIKRHPDHNALLFMWFDTTHMWVDVAKKRPDFKMANLPYVDWTTRSHKEIKRQAAGLSYVDMALEGFLNDPLVSASDIIFTTDHGINFQTLQNPTPHWPRCFGEKTIANTHVEPVEIQIFAAGHSHNPAIKQPAVETSTLDWLYTFTRLNHPAVDVSRWHGRLFSDIGPKTPLLSVSHALRGALRVGGKHMYFTERSCKADGPFEMLEEDQVTPASELWRQTLTRQLNQWGMVPHRQVAVAIRNRTEGCKIAVATKGMLAAAKPITSTTSASVWYERDLFYVPAQTFSHERETVDVVLSADPEACAVVRVGPLQRPIRRSTSLAELGLTRLLELPEAAVKPLRQSSVDISVDPSFFHYEGGTFVVTTSSHVTTISSDLRAAMKSWGYIQDEKK